MELLTGVSLETAMRRQSPTMTVAEFISVMVQVARALAEVRAQDRVTVLGLDQPRRLAQLESEEVAGGAGTVLAAD